MKKLLILVLALTFVLSGCVILTTRPPEMPVDTKDLVPVFTEPSTVNTEILETTVAETEPPVPEFVVPAVVTAESYEKEAIDTLGYGGMDFTHKVEYPKIDSELPGAAAFNTTIAERYSKFINELKADNEGNILYHITYETSVCNDIIFIRMSENIGWQYSEGYDSQKLYYYDAKNDKELSLAEYLAAFNIDRDKLDVGVRHSYDLATTSLGVSPYLCEEIGGEKLGSPSPDTLAYRGYERFDDTVEFDGVEIIAGDKPIIRAYFYGTVYITSTFACDVYLDTYEPVRPNYAGYSIPGENVTENKDIIINFENGKATSVAMPSEYEIFAIDYSSSEVVVRSYKNIENCEISINGGEPYSWGNGSYDTETGEFADTFYIGEYIPINEFSSIVITITE